MHSIILLCALISAAPAKTLQSSSQLASYKQQQIVAGFLTDNLYSDPTGAIVAAKFRHIRSGAPVFLLQIETVPKAFMWIDTPDQSDRGVPHALEHLLAGKGTKGRYVTLLTDMRLSHSEAATERDFNFYSFASGTGLDGFFEQLHAWLDALFRADFTDTEAERELYHFGVSSNEHGLTLVEQGSVYDEEQSGQSTETYYFELNRRLLGNENPLRFDIRGIPAAMRDVTPLDIRRFYQEHYRLGPATGFIFTLDPSESISDFLQKVSREFDVLPGDLASPLAAKPQGMPKYPINTSQNVSPEIYPFPSGRETDAAAIRFGWTPEKIDSSVELKLLQLFFRRFAADQNSVLYKALVDRSGREWDTGTRATDYDVFLQNSPFFPFAQIELSGIPGNRISNEEIDRLRTLVMKKIREISEYNDESPELRSFNNEVLAIAKAWHRSQLIWIKTPPLFGSDLSIDWKNHFESLEMNPSFVRSLTEEPDWGLIESQLTSGMNIWRSAISKFHLLDTPFATASKPSPQLLADMETSKQDRIRRKLDSLERAHNVNNDQEALARFESDEGEKTKQIDAIKAAVSRPRFTDRPPLTADDEIKVEQFTISNAPAIASVFDRPPTLDIGFAFDLRRIPRKYYKYLPILPRSFDSLGLRINRQLVPYPELFSNIHQKTLSFTVAYEENAFSGRVDLVFRASVANAQEFTSALDLINNILHFSNCEIDSADRLRDLAGQRLAADERFGQDEFNVLQNAAYSFQTQQNPLFQAATGSFLRTHWDERLQWKLHPQVNLKEIENLGQFARAIYSKPGISGKQISGVLEESKLSQLERELLEYWQRTLVLLPGDQLSTGLQQLTREVQQDLRVGPARTIAEIKELQQIVINRKALHIDVVGDEVSLSTVKKDLRRFIDLIAINPSHKEVSAELRTTFPIMEKVAARYHFQHANFPWYVGLVMPKATNGDMVFYSDLPGYSDLDRASLVKILSSKIFAGYGPESFFIKTRESGLAYAILLTSNPAYKLLWEYADRSPDVSELVNLLSSVARKASSLDEPLLVDYALRETFSMPRSIYPPASRGIAIAQDLRDGNDPKRVSRFSQAILRLRQDPQLKSELLRTGMSSICGVLLDPQCKKAQQVSHSIFFFVGSEKILSDAEKRLSIPKLLHVFPSDYWLD